MYRAPHDEDFKKSIVTLFQNGKSQLSKEYGVSLSAINKWVFLYRTVKTEDGELLGLTWESINFDKKIITLNKQIVLSQQKRILFLDVENRIKR